MKQKIRLCSISMLLQLNVCGGKWFGIFGACLTIISKR